MLVLPELLHPTMQPRKSSIFSPLILHERIWCISENLLLSSFSSKSRKGRLRFYILISAIKYLKFTLKRIYREHSLYKESIKFKNSMSVFAMPCLTERPSRTIFFAFAFLNLICFVHLPLFVSAAWITLKSGTQGSNYQIMGLFLNMQSVSSQVQVKMCLQKPLMYIIANWPLQSALLPTPVRNKSRIPSRFLL